MTQNGSLELIEICSLDSSQYRPPYCRNSQQFVSWESSRDLWWIQTRLCFSEEDEVRKLRQNFLQAFSDSIAMAYMRFQQDDHFFKECVDIDNEVKLENNAKVKAVIPSFRESKVLLVFINSFYTHLVCCRARLTGLIFEDIIEIDVLTFLVRMWAKKWRLFSQLQEPHCVGGFIPLTVN